MRVLPGSILADLAPAQQLADDRVVVGQLPDAASADQVGPTVAHVGQGRPLLVRQKRHQGRPHSREFGVLLRFAVDGSVGGSYCVAKPLGEAGSGSLQGLDCLKSGLGSQLAGHLAGGVAPHPVCDQIQAQLGRKGVAILVLLPPETDVGAGSCAKDHPVSLPEASPDSTEPV